MANFKSTIVTKQEAAATGIPNGVINGDDISGLLLLATAQYTLLGTEAENDTLQLFDLPPGAVLVPQLSHVTSADPGTTLTFDVGDAGDTDRYADGIVCSAGGQIGFCSGTLPAAVLAPYRDNSAPTRIVAKFDSANTLTAGVVLTFTIAYRAKA
jgi:hypothetical protein